MFPLLIIALVVLVAVAVLGFSIHGLLWLAIVALIVFLALGAVGYRGRGRLRR